MIVKRAKALLANAQWARLQTTRALRAAIDSGDPARVESARARYIRAVREAKDCERTVRSLQR